MMAEPWLTVIGIGDDGPEGLAPASRALVDAAEVLVGGERHLAALEDKGAERVTWGSGFSEVKDRLGAFKDRRVVVLASGDPLFYGAGSVLARRFGVDAVRVIPAPGAISLAAARLSWSIPDTEVTTVHGRPLEMLNYHLFPGRRILALSRDGDSPAEVAALLTARGFGTSRVTVFEHLGGPKENRLDGVAADWPHGRAADLNTIAIDCVAGPDARIYPRVPGLPDKAFQHDGQITKRVVRAATIAALGPLPEQTLWDVGAGSGAVAIEWMRAECSARAVAFERDAARAATCAANAHALGVPMLNVVTGEAPTVLADRTDAPDAVFVGGGVSVPGQLATAWDALKPGGRLVANAVTLDAEQEVLRFHRAHGGTLTRIGVDNEDGIGSRRALKPSYRVLQLALDKPHEQ